MADYEYTFRELDELSLENQRALRDDLRKDLVGEIQLREQMIGEIMFLQNEIKKYRKYTR